jgi:RimJ/RimL family protein N-acetyltransferase
MEDRDAACIVRWRNNPDIKKWFFNQMLLTVESHLNWFRSEEKQKRYDYIICDAVNGKQIGTINFSNIADNEAEIGKLIGEKDYVGKGYAKEATYLWLYFGFNTLGFSKIIAKTMHDNIDNIKLNEKFGFLIEKEDAIVYNNKTYNIMIMSLNKEDFKCL